VDKLTPKARSENMRQIRSKNTSPEIIVRKLVFSLGYRYRLHRKDLPGNPDLVFPARKKVIFVHGCFWHQHNGCREGRVPGSRQEYWAPKLERNKARDEFHLTSLKQLGWKALVIWECELKQLDASISRIVHFLQK
jgi:DNA mismatch endonuclease, patch repair protein